MAITCCYGCVPPKRTHTCHFDGTCQEYIKQKEEHDAKRGERNKRVRTEVEIYQQRGDSVRRAIRNRK